MTLSRTRTQLLTGLGAAGLVTATIAVSPSTPASADPPPAAAGTTSHGFVAHGRVVRTIDHPDATVVPASPDGQAGTAITGNNDHGQLLGAYEDSDRVVHHFVRDRTGRYREIEDPPGGSDLDEYVDLNNRGDAVGFLNDDRGFTTTGFLRGKNGHFTRLRVPGSQVTGPVKLNDRRQVVGLYVDDGVVHGFRWDAGRYTTIDVRGAEATIPFGINNKGVIVGTYVDGKGVYHAFRRDRRGKVTTLRDAPRTDAAAGDATLPAGINDHGQIVGAVYYAEGGSRGFLLDRGRYRMIDGKRKAVYTRALDINNRSQIVGDYGTRPRADARSSSGDSAVRPAMSILPDGLRLPGGALD
jgi:hypothetical protein